MKLLFVGILVSLLVGCSASGEVKMLAGLGEHQNIHHTEQQRVEIRTDINDRFYSYTRIENNMNPSDNVPDDIALQGAGISFGEFSGEAAVNEEYYLWTVRYDHETNWGEVFGGFTHLNKWEQKNSKNTAFIGSGYSITENISIGGFYEVGNVEQKYVDDLYGGYVKVSW